MCPLATHPQAQGPPAGGPTPHIKLPGEGPSHFETVSLFLLPQRRCFMLRLWGLLGKIYSVAFTMPWDEVSRPHATLVFPHWRPPTWQNLPRCDSAWPSCYSVGCPPLPRGPCEGHCQACLSPFARPSNNLSWTQQEPKPPGFHGGTSKGGKKPTRAIIEIPLWSCSK